MCEKKNQILILFQFFMVVFVFNSSVLNYDRCSVQLNESKQVYLNQIQSNQLRSKKLYIVSIA